MIGAYHFLLVDAVFALAVFVVPGFLVVFEDFAKPLPLVTRHLVAFADWSVNWAVLIAPLLLLSVVSHALLYYILAAGRHKALASIYRVAISALAILVFALGLIALWMPLARIMEEVGQG